MCPFYRYILTVLKTLRKPLNEAVKQEMEHTKLLWNALEEKYRNQCVELGENVNEKDNITPKYADICTSHKKV